MPNSGSFAFGLPPETAIDWFAKKHISTANYRDLTPAEHAKAFTIAGITQLDMLNDIKTSLNDALNEGKSLGKWKSELLDTLTSKGWLNKLPDGSFSLFDKDTGEYFGAPYRLANIYRTNMQSAFSAQRFQTHMDNVDNRPYWLYDAVNDHRTRPAHAEQDQKVYRYDDPFWTVWYPPNGYQCRCSVTALNDRDLARRGLSVSETQPDDVTTAERIRHRAGDTLQVRGIKQADGTVKTPDVGFDFHTGRMNYRPNLDDYDVDLAHEFAKREMAGADFDFGFNRLNDAMNAIRDGDGKIKGEALVQLRNRLTTWQNYTAGMLPERIYRESAALSRTVWLSDDTLIKQLENRKGQGFGREHYAHLPAVIFESDLFMFSARADKYYALKQIDGRWYLAVLKLTKAKDEWFVVSVRFTDEQDITRLRKHAIEL